MTQKKVLHIIHLPNPFAIGGAELSSFNLMEHLLNHYQVSAMLLTETEESFMADMLRKENIPVVICPAVEHITDFNQIKQTLSSFRKLRPDLLHIQNNYFRASPYLPLLARFAGIDKIVVSERTNYPRQATILGQTRKNLMGHLVDRTVAVSSSVRDTLVQLYKYPASKVRVIHNAVDVAEIANAISKIEEGSVRMEIGISHEARVIGTIANFMPYKGLLYLIRAMEKVVRLFPNCHLLLVGDGVQRPAIEEAILDYDLARSISLVGWQEDITPFLAIMDIFVLPSLSEGFPRSVLEAMAARLPVIATDIDGTSELIEHGFNGILIPPANYQAISQALERLLLDQELAYALAQQAQSFVIENYAIHQLAAEYRRLYSELGVV